jgi:hypothetical protein
MDYLLDEKPLCCVALHRSWRLGMIDRYGEMEKEMIHKREIWLDIIVSRECLYVSIRMRFGESWKSSLLRHGLLSPNQSNKPLSHSNTDALFFDTPV